MTEPVESLARRWVPKHLLSCLDRYVEHGTDPGSFLRAVLENDLFAAMRSAHPATVHASKDLVKYISAELPCACYGSKRAVADWVRYGGLRGYA